MYVVLLCQFSLRCRIFTFLIEHWWPVFNLCSLTADSGWRHDRCSLIRVQSGLAVSAMYCWWQSQTLDVIYTLLLCPVHHKPINTLRALLMHPEDKTPHVPACVTWCKSCDTTMKFSMWETAELYGKQRKKVSLEVNHLLINNVQTKKPDHYIRML